MRRAAKRDANEQAIVDALESVGAIVRRINDTALPDLAVYYRRRWFLMECKVPGGKLTPAQEALHALAPFPVVDSAEGAVSLLFDLVSAVRQ